jgi:CcmD family protein
MLAQRDRGRGVGLLRALLLAALVAAFAGALSGGAWAQQPQVQKSQDEFVPVKDLGQQEQLPAAPLLVAAYVVVWLALLVYLWSIWRRLGKVDQELSALTRRIAEMAGADKRG